MRSISIQITALEGHSIEEVCGDVKELSEFMGKDLAFNFNGVPMCTHNKSIREMVASYTTARKNQ